MSNSERDSTPPTVSSREADSAPTSRNPTGLNPKLSKGMDQLGAQVEKQLTSLAGKPAAPGSKAPGSASTQTGSTQTGSTQTGAAQTGAASAAEGAAADALGIRITPGAGWMALVALAAGVGVWWWKKRKAAKKPAAPEPAKKSKPALDMYADWKSFHRRLPSSMRRVLDDLQPVIVLGNNASEKEMLSLQLSRVADNEQLFPTRVSYRGQGLDLYLGARSLVLVPSDEFLDAPASSEDESWRKLLLKVCRVRAPRVVVCLAQAPLDAGNLDEVTLWTSKLRAHVDVIVAVRNEDIELSIALVQGPTSSRSTTPRSTDALFELLGSLGKHEGLEETLSLRIDALSDQLSPRVEERRESAKRWVIEKLRRSRKGWPRLLAHPEYDSTRLLTLARFFEEFENWSASLGAGLAELLVHDERRTQRVLGQELCFLPCVDRRLIGTLAAFAGPSEARTGRWRPKQSLVHRLVVASAASVLALGLWISYEYDRLAWDEAATAAERYAAYDQDNDLDVVRNAEQPGARDLTLVRDYVQERAGSSLLPRFFDRDVLRCMTVESVRSYVSKMLHGAADSFDPPEKLIQLIGLLIAGNVDECDIAASDPNRQPYRELADLIKAHTREWRHLTYMSDAEIEGYLALACPQTQLDLTSMLATYGKDNARDSAARKDEWPEVEKVADLGASLDRLSGQCELSADELIALQEAETIAYALEPGGEHHGAALAALKVLRRISSPATNLLPRLFNHHEKRLKDIENLSNENETVLLLARDVRAFGEPRKVCSLDAFNEQLLGRGLRRYSDEAGAAKAAPTLCSLDALDDQLRGSPRRPSAHPGAAQAANEVCSLRELNRQLLARGLPQFSDEPGGAHPAQRECSLETFSSRLARTSRAPADAEGALQTKPKVNSLDALNRQLLAQVRDEPDGEDAIVRLTVANETYVIDREKVRSSLLVRALGRLQRDFVDTTTTRELAAQSAEVVFFGDTLRARTHAWAPQVSIPDGVRVNVEVPWRYTSAGFRHAVLEPIGTMYAPFNTHICDAGKDEQTRDELLGDATSFISERLSIYLRAYAETWRDIYASFEIAATDDGGLAETLAALARPTSIQVALLNEVLRQTRLEAPSDWPFVDALGIASMPFDTLQGVVDEKALAEYQGFILELATAGQDTDEASATGWPAATLPAAPGAAASAPNPTDARDAFIAGLSGFGRVVATGLYDAKADVHQRARDWADRLGLSPAARQPLMRPIEAAYARGVAGVERGLDYFWVQKSGELRAAITDRFPFDEHGRDEADIDDLKAWLDPLEGRFTSEVLPIYELVARCRPNPCVALPPGMQASVERLLAIRQALFDAKGQPSALKFQIEPVPFATQPLPPKRATLRLGETRYDYFNTAPRALTVSVPWNEAYVASLNVELAGAQASDDLAFPIETAASPWALFRLLTSGKVIDRRYSWELDAPLQGSRQGTVRVSYDVCRDFSRCGGLLQRVFAWP